MCEESNVDKVRILMATFNGGLFLEEQIQSLIDQTYRNWELLIRDDGSSDQTLHIIEEFKKNDKRISKINDNIGNVRSCQNFSKLMEVPSDSPYIMFCDQDDVWKKDKIERSLQAMKKLEREFGSDKNLLVYGTYNMIDEGGVTLPLDAPDYSTKPNLKLLLSQNYIYGCTILINRNLLSNSTPIPLTAENHDYWIVLSAIVHNAYFSYVKEPLLFYRQHSSNVSGSFKNAFLINRIKRIFSYSEVKSIENRLGMYDSLYERFKNNMSKTHLELIEGYLESVNDGGWKALAFCIKNKIGRRGKIQSLLFYYNLMRKS